MTTINATKLPAELYRLLQRVSENHEPVHIAGRRAVAVLII